MDDEDRKQQKRQLTRRNYIQRDLRDLRGPFSTKVMPNRKKEEYKRPSHKDWTDEREDLD